MKAVCVDDGSEGYESIVGMSVSQYARFKRTRSVKIPVSRKMMCFESANSASLICVVSRWLGVKSGDCGNDDLCFNSEARRVLTTNLT